MHTRKKKYMLCLCYAKYLYLWKFFELGGGACYFRIHPLGIKRAMMDSKWSNSYLLLPTKTFLLVVGLGSPDQLSPQGILSSKCLTLTPEASSQPGYLKSLTR